MIGYTKSFVPSFGLGLLAIRVISQNWRYGSDKRGSSSRPAPLVFLSNLLDTWHNGLFKILNARLPLSKNESGASLNLPSCLLEYSLKNLKGALRLLGAAHTRARFSGTFF